MPAFLHRCAKLGHFTFQAKDDVPEAFLGSPATHNHVVSLSLIGTQLRNPSFWVTGQATSASVTALLAAPDALWPVVTYEWPPDWLTPPLGPLARRALLCLRWKLTNYALLRFCVSAFVSVVKRRFRKETHSLNVRRRQAISASPPSKKTAERRDGNGGSSTDQSPPPSTPPLVHVIFSRFVLSAGELIRICRGHEFAFRVRTDPPPSLPHSFPSLPSIPSDRPDPSRRAMKEPTGRTR